MAPRRDRADVVEVEPTADEFSEVDTPAETDDPETSPDGETVETSKKAEKAEKARGDLKEGWVTPVGLAKVLSQPRDGNKDNLDPANWYHTGVKNPSDHEVRPQMVYSYKKNAQKED